MVGGLGLGYTARGRARADPRVGSLTVVEALGEVIGWHERGLLPLAAQLTADARCRLVQGDFFALVAERDRRSGRAPDACHAVLLDIDHSPATRAAPQPRCVLHARTGCGSSPTGCTPAASSPCGPTIRRTRSSWRSLGEVFAYAQAHVVSFANPLTGGTSANTVYVATVPTG